MVVASLTLGRGIKAQLRFFSLFPNSCANEPVRRLYQSSTRCWSRQEQGKDWEEPAA